jgi:uncharacterized DUF497 family protein
MHRISRLEWDEENVQHIGTHGISPDEVEELCYSGPLFLCSRAGTRVAYGQTLGGRYLIVVLALRENAAARCITARTMTDKERRFYRNRRLRK